MFSHSLRERHLPQPWRIHAARASASRRPLTTASDSLSVRFPVSRGASRSGEHLLSILVNEATGSVVAEGRRVRSGRAWSDSDEPQLCALPRGLRRPRPHCLFRCSATVGRPTRLGHKLTALDPWWNSAVPAHGVGSAPAARRISAVAGWGPSSAHSSGVLPVPWSSRRLGSAPCAKSCRTVSVCPQHAAAHSGVPSEPGPALSVSGGAPASKSRRAMSASPCTDARYSGVVPSLLLRSGHAPLPNSAFVVLASPARTASKRRRESFFWWRCFIARR